MIMKSYLKSSGLLISFSMTHDFTLLTNLLACPRFTPQYIPCHIHQFVQIPGQSMLSLDLYKPVWQKTVSEDVSIQQHNNAADNHISWKDRIKMCDQHSSWEDRVRIYDHHVSWEDKVRMYLPTSNPAYFGVSMSATWDNSGQ